MHVPRALLVDIDDTLYAYAPAEEAGIAAVEALRPAVPIRQVYLQARGDLVRERPAHAAGRCRVSVFLRVAEVLQMPCPPARAVELERVYRQAFLAAMVPHAEPVAFMRRCREAGTRLCAVTDTLLRPQLMKLGALGLSEWFDGVVTAEETGVEKPDPLMFMTALRKLQVPARDALMIGDRADRDIAGARACGIAAVQVCEGRMLWG